MSDKQFEYIFNVLRNGKKKIAVLVDPDKFDPEHQKDFIEKIKFTKLDFIFIGGSSVGKLEFTKTCQFLKHNCALPLIGFPGDVYQYSKDLDALLYLSLLSGRNPEYLIGQHIKTSTEIVESGIETIPTSYLLIDGGTYSSTGYVSQTIPIPQEEKDIIYRTALAGKLQGKSLLYLDAGSGAKHVVSKEIIKSCASIGQPLIVGGGIRSIKQISEIHQAGADVVVIGNHIEENTDFLLDLAEYAETR